MEGCLTDLGKTFAEKLINGAIQKSRYVFCFKCIAKEFEEEKDKLEYERITMRQRFTVAIERDKDIQFNAQSWEKQANKLIEEDTKTKHRCFFGFFPDCIWRYKRGEELTSKIEEIKKLMEKGGKFENVELARHLPGVERYSSKDYISFESRELIYKELLEALKDDDNYYITGLHGMGGTGKTTLANEVGKQLKTLQQFKYVVDTTVSSTPDIKKIQDDIAGPLGLNWGDINESDRPKKLWSRLTNGEKILVILDDVWGHLSFDDIGIPKNDNHKGCKVLVTTRSLRVCNQLACGKTIQLELLSEEDAWIMFKLHADLSNTSSHKSFLDKGRKIATECKRLPVAIATVANSLKGQKHREEWDYALKSLQKPLSRGSVDDDLVNVYRCLKFSYDYLKNEKAKRLFLLFSLYPEDEEIDVERLIRLGIGIGLFGEDYVSYDDARSQALVAKNKLIDLCLLLETSMIEIVKMHDLVREVAHWIAKEEIQTINLYNKNQKALDGRDKNIKYLVCEGNLMDFFSFRFDGSKLEVLIFDTDMRDSVEFPISFFENIARLRVLFLSNRGDFRTNQLLPQSILSLKNIRSLYVYHVDLGDISVLGSLQSLETLELSCCEIDELPCEIASLKKFKLLSLEMCNIRSKDPFEVIQICSTLQELYFFGSFNSFCENINLPALQRYYLSDGDSIGSVSLSKCASFEHDYFSEETFKYVMATIESLHLKYFKKEWTNFIPEIVPINNGMNDLIKLDLETDSELECLIDTTHIDDSQVTNVFSKLVMLNLKKMYNLEELCNGTISFGSLNNLENLSIEKCEYLTSLFKCSLNLCNLTTVRLVSCSTLVSVFDLSTSRSLLLLKYLQIDECEQLENIFTYERRIGDMIEEVDDDNDNNMSFNSMFPNLKSVNIKRCHQLQFIFPLHSAKDLLSLEDITIQFCDKLEYIFGQHQDVELASLKELQLKELPNFIGMFPESSQLMSSSIKDSYDSISKPQTQLEPIKCNIFSWSHICCHRYKLKGSTSTEIPSISENQPQENYSISMVSNYLARCLSRSISMCNTTVIKLAYISKMKSVFMLSIAPKMLLESLTIESCHELEHIIVDIGDGSGRNECGNVFPKLKKLKVISCNKLEHIFGHINASDDHDQNHKDEELIHLHLEALKCLELLYLPSLIGICTKNYRTTSPNLTEVDLDLCPQLELSGNMDCFLNLKRLEANKISKIESIFCLNEVNEQQANLDLQHLQLDFLPMMKCLFVGPKNYFALNNLASLKINQCEILKVVFSTSIIRCLPQLYYLNVENCQELMHIIEDDTENKNMSDFVCSETCFPKLEMLVVVNCYKLKSVFPISICNEVPQLKGLFIHGSNELQEIIETKGDQKVEIPNLKLVAFTRLPSLSPAQGIQFQVIPNCIIRDCQNVSPTSTLSTNMENFTKSLGFDPDYELQMRLHGAFRELQGDTSPWFMKMYCEISSSGMSDDFADELEVEAILGHILDSSQHLKETKDESIEEEGSMSDESIKEEGSTSETKNEPHILSVDLKQKSIELSVEDITTLVPNVKTVTSPTHSEPLVIFEHKTSSLSEGSTSAAAAATLFTISETNNEPAATIQLVAPKQKVIEISVEEGTTSTYANTVTSSTHFEDDDDDGKLCIPSLSIVNTKPPSTKDVDIGDYQETIAMKDINKLIEEDPLLALEELLTGVPSFSIGTLLQELKILMDSSSGHDHIVSNQDSKSKLISLFHGLNQHQGLLPSDVKEFVEKVQNFFNDIIIKQATSQQALKMHNQLIDSKIDLMNKLSIAKSTQTQIDSETSTANAQIHELSLQIVELRNKLADLENQRDGWKVVVNQCDVQKMNLKAECTEWAQQSKKFLSALASSEVDIREAEHARNLAKERFANLKSSFPTFYRKE